MFIKNMKLIKGISLAILMVSMIAIASCDSSSSKKAASTGSSLSMKLDMTLAKGIAGDTVILTSAKVLLKNIKFKSSIDEDSLDFKVGPIVVELNLAGGVTNISAGKIPNGTYDKVKFKIHKPEDDSEIADTSFTTGERYSMIISGTYNGTPFTYRSKKDIEQELRIEPPMVISDSLTDANTTLLVAPNVWFKKNGVYIDPALESNRSDIDDNIKKSFKKAIKDNDHDGKDGDDDDDDDDDDKDGDD